MNKNDSNNRNVECRMEQCINGKMAGLRLIAVFYL